MKALRGCGYVEGDCGQSYLNEQAARIAGWGIWSGLTRGGEQVDLRFCPAHRDLDAVTDTGDPIDEGFDAECTTCSWTASEDWNDDWHGTEKQASEWMSDHQCEPDTQLIRPRPVGVEASPEPAPSVLTA